MQNTPNTPQLAPQPSDSRPAWDIALRAWSAAKDKPGYDKSKWQDARALLGFP